MFECRRLHRHEWSVRAAAVLLAVLPALVVSAEPEPASAPIDARTTAFVCSNDIDCDDCDPCTNDACASGTCENVIRFDGASCDDGLFCNGVSVCQSGACVAQSPVDCAALGQVCDESLDVCVDPCVDDSECDDGLVCTTDACISPGVCVNTPDVCGPDGFCREPIAPATDPNCGVGRCCDVAGNCSRATFADCEALSGNWLAVGRVSTTCVDEPCPLYSAGIAPHGQFPVSVGPISQSACRNLTELGDDYQIGDGTGFFEVSAVRWVGRVENAGDVVTLVWYDANGTFIEDEFFTVDTTELTLHTFELPPDFVVPGAGFAALRVAGPFNLNAQLHWASTDAVDIGTNDPTSLWINAAPGFGDALGRCDAGTRKDLWCDRRNGNIDCLPGGTCTDVPDVLALEIVGEQTFPPLGGCCDGTTGTCSDELPWVCENGGGVFQGVGSLCRVCENDFFKRCTTSADCLACNISGDACTTNDECPPGETCSAESACLAVSPGCSIQACCNTTDGTCTQTTGICSIPGPLGPIPCVDNAGCLPDNGTCVNNACPLGTVSNGFGTTCDPNCCQQPVSTGNDSCTLATVQPITVPQIGDPPVTVTITGDNAPATFNDWFEGQCEGGTNPGAFCDPDSGRCTNGASCSVFGQNCADGSTCVTDHAALCSGGGTCVQLCGSDLFDPNGATQDLGWWEVFAIDACAEVRIDFCCTDPQRVLNHALLFPDCPCGEPIAPTAIDPPMGPGDGRGSAFGRPFCDDDNFWMTFGPLPPGTYYYPVFSPFDEFPVGRPYQLHVTAGACPIAACCTGDVCNGSLTELECAALGGYWLGASNVPGNPVFDCLTGTPGVTPCNTGSCCLGFDGCVDEVLGGALTKADCDALGGTFVGGAKCSFPTPPCQACFADGATNCQPIDGSVALLSDLEPGVTQADNFIATNDIINTVCVSGAWVDSVATGPRVDCACQGDDTNNCVSVVTDQFRVAVYEDQSGDGLPDTLVESTTATILFRTLDRPFSNFDLWTVSLSLDTPINVVPGECYWLEVANNTTDAPASCNWYWSNSTGFGDGAGTSGDGTLPPTSATSFDTAFCLDMEILPGGCVADPLGACCGCDGVCEEPVPASACTAGLFLGDGSSCFDCPSFDPPRDDCVTEIAPIGLGASSFSNACATTDGPTPVTCESGDQVVGDDIWFAYTASDDGVLLVDLCNGTDFDAIAVVYGDQTATCVCPTDAASQLACDDNSCSLGAASAASAAPPVPCEEPNCGRQAPQLCLPVTRDACYTIRLGGVDGARGSGVIDVKFGGPVIYVNEGAGGANNGSSWGDAFNDLQDALDLTRRIVACPGVTLNPQVWVARGTYTPDRGSGDRAATFELSSRVALYGGFAGGETSVGQRDPLAHPTMLSGDIDFGGGAAGNSFHVVTASDTGPSAILDGFFVESGNTALATVRRGGGLLIDNASPTIVNCVFRNCLADVGGATLVDGGAPLFANCLWHDNSAIDSGAIRVQSGSPTFANCTITRNSALGLAGGLGQADGTATVLNGILWANTDDGGTTEPSQIAVTGGAADVRYCDIQGYVGLVGGQGNIDADPLFVNPAGNNFKLSAGSPCIDAGDSIAVPNDLSDTDGDGLFGERLPVDLAHVERFLNDGTTPDTGRGAPPNLVDIGAFEFEPDCNANGVRDDLDIASLSSPDCSGDGVPDECQVPPLCPTCVDCNASGVPDDCELPDCNGNDIPDACEIDETTPLPGPFFCPAGSPDCDEDCNVNGIPDACDIETCLPSSPEFPGCDDCTGNGRPDACDIADGSEIDADGDGVPDDCINSAAGAAGSWSDGAQWVGNLPPSPESGVTLTGAELSLDVDAQVDALRIFGNSSLSISLPSISSNLTANQPIRNAGTIVLDNHRVTAPGLELDGRELGGALVVSGAAEVELSGGELMIRDGGSYEAPGIDPVNANLMVGKASIGTAGCGKCSQLKLRGGMKFRTNSDFVLNGQTELDLCACTQAGLASVLGGKTPPILKIRSPSAVLSDAASRGIVPAPGLTVQGAFRIEHAAEVCVGCDPLGNDPLCGAACGPNEDGQAIVTLTGDFDNRSLFVSMFSWVHGGLRLDGVGPTFEVAGIDLGPTGESFETTAGTNTEPTFFQPHTNFAMGRIEVASGADVTFTNSFANTAGAGNCAEALYVDTLVLEPDAHVTLDNVRVYFNNLDQQTLDENITTVGCGALISNCPGDVCKYSSLVAVNGLNPIVGTCADLDGPQSIGCSTLENSPFTDVWFRYHATCLGEMTVSLCGNTLGDPAITLYNDPTSPTECLCPVDTSTQSGFCADNNCDDGLNLNGEATRAVFPGQCWLIRVQDSKGPVLATDLVVSCPPSTCVPSSPIVTETIMVESPPNSGSFVTEDSVKNRFLSFFVGDPNLQQAIRIIPNGLPAHMACLEGSVWWAQWPPFPVSNSGSSRDPIPGFSNFLATTLIPDSAFDPALVFADWNGVCVAGACQGGLSEGRCAGGLCAGGQNDGSLCAGDTDCAGLSCSNNADCRGMLNALSEIIVPGADYTVQVIQEGCDPGASASFSEPVVIATPRWGDTLKDLTTVPAGPPNGTVDIVDILGIIARFVSAPTSILKPRADLEPSELDLIINISDALQGLNAFSGLPYPFLKCAQNGRCLGGPNSNQLCTGDADCVDPLCPNPPP